MPKLKGLLFVFKLDDPNEKFTLYGDDLGAAKSVTAVSLCEDGSTVEWQEVKFTASEKRIKVKGKPVRTKPPKDPGTKDDVIGDMTVTVNFGGPPQTISCSNIAYE